VFHSLRPDPALPPVAQWRCPVVCSGGRERRRGDVPRVRTAAGSLLRRQSLHLRGARACLRGLSGMERWLVCELVWGVICLSEPGGCGLVWHCVFHAPKLRSGQRLAALPRNLAGSSVS